MTHNTEVPLRHSIATKLLVVVIALYLVVAMVVTFSHVWMEYQNQKESIVSDLENIEEAFVDGLAVDIWGLDQQALKASVEGVLKIPTIVGAKIINAKGTVIAIGGVVKDNEKAGGVGLHVDLSGCAPEDLSVHPHEIYDYEMFKREFPVTYNNKGKDVVLGHTTLYSNSSVIYKRMKLQAGMLILNVSLTLVTFCLALLWAVNRYLRKPLSALSSATEEVNLENLNSFKVSIKTSSRNELKVLEESFNKMIGNLHQSMSERKQAAKDLQRNEENLRITLNSIGDAVIATNAQGMIVSMNPVAEQLTGWNNDEARDKPLLDVFNIISAITKAPCENPVEKVLATGEIIGLANHTVLISKDKTEFQIADSGAPIRNSEGEIVGVVLVFRDVTDEYALQEKLVSSEQRFMRALESVNIGMWDLNVQTGEAIVNESWARILGYTLHELEPVTMETWTTLVHPDDLLKFEAEFDKHLSGVVDRYECEVRLKHKSGHWVEVLDRGKVFEWTEDGSPLRVIGTEEDITERKQTDDKLRQSEKMQAIGQLAGGVAHDFNNMLGGIIGASELLGNKVADNEQAKKYTELILQTAERAAELTDKLLAFSRKGRNLSTSVDIHKIIIETIAILERSIDKRITLLSGFKARCSKVIGDPAQLQSAILNLGLNARDAISESGEITISTENIELDQKYCDASSAELIPKQYIQISIRDTGSGIPSEAIGNIFEPFFTTKEQGKGTGLGLAAVYGTVCDHKGDVKVYSEQGRGSVFHVYLPVDENSCAIDVQPQEQYTVTSGAGMILVVDDEEIMRITISHALEDMGFNVILAENGEEAVELYCQNMNEINLVILDMVMPIMNGTEAFREILKVNPKAKIIMASGFTKDAKVTRLIKEGLVGFIKKPFRQSELAKILSEVLS